MELDLRLLRSFVAVAEDGSITRAAQRLHLAQQAVSVQMQQLERALGVALLIRTSRGVLLTAAGQELAASGAQTLANLEELAERVRAVARGEAGQLRIVCKPHITAEFAVEIVEAMEKAVPGIGIELTTVSTLHEELNLLTTGAVDAGFLWLPLGDKRLRHTVVRSDRRMVAVPDTHRLAGQPAIKLADLAGEPMIVRAGPVAPEVEAHWLAEPRPDGSPVVRGPAADRLEDQLLLVARGHGVWLAPEPVSRYFPAHRIRWLPVLDAEPSLLTVVWTAAAPETPVTRLVTEVRAVTGWADAHDAASVEASPA